MVRPTSSPFARRRRRKYSNKFPRNCGRRNKENKKKTKGLPVNICRKTSQNTINNNQPTDHLNRQIRDQPNDVNPTKSSIVTRWQIAYTSAPPMDRYQVANHLHIRTTNGSLCSSRAARIDNKVSKKKNKHLAHQKQRTSVGYFLKNGCAEYFPIEALRAGFTLFYGRRAPHNISMLSRAAFIPREQRSKSQLQQYRAAHLKSDILEGERRSVEKLHDPGITHLHDGCDLCKYIKPSEQTRKNDIGRYFLLIDR